jgi:hypothetical protein
MNNETILKKAIEKAVKNGWKHTFSFMGEKEGIKDMFEVCLGDDNKLNNNFMTIVFSHDFAKAFFPKGWTCFKNGQWQDCDEGQQFLSETPFVLEKWQYHLQRIVLLPDDERLKYLEKFL